MLNPVSAELLKLRRHRATWMLVWIFPIGAFVIPMIVILAQLAQGTAPSTADVSRWIGDATDFWDLPPDTLGRFLIGSFVAVAFAGEYGWNTWKLVVPHRSRTTLLVAKYVVTVGLVYAAFLIAAPMVTGFKWLEDVLTGDVVPDGIGAGALIAAHGERLLAGLPTILFTVSLSAFAAIMTRSTTAAIIVSIVYVMFEQLFRVFAPAFALYVPGVETLFELLPGYHLANIMGWLSEGQGAVQPFASGHTTAYALGASLAVVAAWIAILVALTVWRFRKQDIN